VIRNSVVAKLWLTIVGLFIIVLLLLSIFLEQLFNNYFTKTEEDDLRHRMSHMASVVDEYNQATAQIVINELAKEQAAVPSYIEDPDQMAKIMSKLSTEELAQIVSGNTVVEQDYAPRWNSSQKRDQKSFWVLQPVINNGQVVGLLYVVQPISANAAMSRVQVLLFFSAGLGILMATGLAFVVSKNLSSPLVQMNKVAEQMATGDFQGKVQVITTDEVGLLGQTLNQLAYKLEENIDDLEREKEQLASIITSMTDGVFAADLNGTITLANPPARRYIRAQALVETGNYASYTGLPRDLYEMVQTVMKTRQSLDDEVQWQGRVLVITMVPLYEKDGESLRGVVSVMRDITDERTLEKMRRDFIANVSHELRTPLAMMQGYSEALLDEFGDDPEQRQELTQIILDETHRMRRLVNDLLDLAQLESGQFKMNDEQVDMEHLIRRIGRKFTTLSNERDVQLHVEVDESKMPAYVLGDTDRLEQVFTNLADNAFRHTPQGGQITIRLTRDESLVRVAVQDTGEGIPAEDVPFLFERFYKVDKARTRSKGGTGLGLAITYNIMKNHNGDIVVDSEVGTGTTFNVLLPLLKA
jgi:two-component system, OmpR family, sensor histidine kinase ResE